jgi:hypothetical protein
VFTSIVGVKDLYALREMMRGQVQVEGLGVDALFHGRGYCAGEITHGETGAVHVDQKLLQHFGEVAFLVEEVNPFISRGAVHKDEHAFAADEEQVEVYFF